MHRLAVCCWCLALAVFAFGRAPKSYAQEEVTVRGEIVDLACYMAKGSRGPTHKACAQLCAKKGVPMGVVTDEGQVFLLLTEVDNSGAYDAAITLAGERAEVTGKKFSKEGIAGIAVGSVKVAASAGPDRLARLPIPTR